MPRNSSKTNRYKNVDDVFAELDLDNMSFQIPISRSSSHASITSLPESEPDYELNTNQIDLNSEHVKLQIQATHLVAEFVEARREFINAYDQWLMNRKLVILELYQLSEDLDNWKFGKDVSQAAGSGLGIIGGAVGITGAITVLTGGAAIPAALIFAGIGVGLTGGVTSLSGNIMETIADKRKAKKAIEALAEDEENTSKVVNCYEALKLTMFEAKFVLDRHASCRKIIHSKLTALDVPTETFNPHGLIHHMKVEQLNTAEYGNSFNYVENEILNRPRSSSDAVEEIKNAEKTIKSADSKAVSKFESKNLKNDTKNAKTDVSSSMKSGQNSTGDNPDNSSTDFQNPSKHGAIYEAADGQDFSRGASALATTVGGGNTVKDVVGIVMKNGLQSAQSLAVGLGGAFIVIDLYQIFNASRSLNKGSMSETAGVLRLKGDQLLEQQLFFNQIYEYLR